METLDGLIKAAYGPPEAARREVKRPPEAKAEPVKEPARAITTMTAAELLQSDLPPRADVIGGGVLPKGGLALLAGQFKSGKTILALQVALETVRGGRVLDFDTTPGRVLLLNGEGGPQLLRERLEKMTEGNLTGLDDLLLWWPTESRLDLAEEESRAALAAYCKGQKIELLIIDPLIRFNSLDENSTLEMGRFVRGLADLRQETGTAILLVHHTRKPSKGGGSGAAEARGSTVLHGEADSLMVLQSRRANNDFTLQFELRWAEEPPALRLELDPGTLLFNVVGEVEGNRKLTEGRLYDLLVDQGPCSKESLAEITRTTDRTVQKYLITLEKQGLVDNYIEPGSRGRKLWFVMNSTEDRKLN